MKSKKIGNLLLVTTIAISLLVIIISNLQNPPQQSIASIPPNTINQKSFLNISSNLLFWTLITFIALTALLSKYAWKPIIHILDQRSQLIQSQIQDAQKSKQDAQNLLDQQKLILNQAKQEAQKIIQLSKNQASKQSQHIIHQAQQHASSILNSAQIQIQKSKNSALKDIKSQITSLSFSIAQKLIAQSLNPKDHQKIVDDAILTYEQSNQQFDHAKS